MKAIALLAIATLPALGPCGKQPPAVVPEPLPPRVDTVIVTKEVIPPLPEGTPDTVCLSTGFPMPVRIAANGDTLIGERRVRLQDIRPGLVFEGAYAAGKPWVDKGEITFERRVYRKFGTVNTLECDDLKQIGEQEGVPLFADAGAPSPVETIQVPLMPGRFQAFRTTLPRRR